MGWAFGIGCARVGVQKGRDKRLKIYRLQDPGFKRNHLTERNSALVFMRRVDWGKQGILLGSKPCRACEQYVDRPAIV